MRPKATAVRAESDFFELSAIRTPPLRSTGVSVEESGMGQKTDRWKQEHHETTVQLGKDLRRPAATPPLPIPRGGLGFDGASPDGDNHAIVSPTQRCTVGAYRGSSRIGPVWGGVDERAIEVGGYDRRVKEGIVGDTHDVLRENHEVGPHAGCD